MQTRRLATSFEGFNSSLAQPAEKLMELQSGAIIAAQCMISKLQVFCTPATKVLTTIEGAL